MKRLQLIPFFFLLASVSFLSTTALYAEEKVSSPRDEMQTTLNDLVRIVMQYKGDENQQVRRTKMRAIIEPKFNFEEMAKRSLGVKWKSIAEPERKEFIDLFSKLLANTYLGRIEKVEENMVEIRSELLRFPRALVKTTVAFNGDTFPLDYKLIYRDNQWKVYDVIIENIGLISNYRSEFAGIIRKEKFSGLLARLRKKTNKTRT